MKGSFIISLDFELHWGGAEKWNLNERKVYFNETRRSIILVLELFKKYNLSVTWATVGFLFNENITEFINNIPIDKPTYNNLQLNYYNLVEILGENEAEDPYHYAKSLIDLILSYPRQELGSHTYCHYYALEDGQNSIQFDTDLSLAQKIAIEKYNIKLKSLVFPRNQFNDDYIEIAEKNDFTVVRSNPNVWFWKRKEGRLTSLFRACDTLLSISKSVCFTDSDIIKKDGVVCLPASRFFRSFKKREIIIQYFKMRRIKNEMTYAAKNGLHYHLWWHPHNLADDVDVNMKQLEDILQHFSFLNKKYQFKSLNMGDFSE